MAGAQGGAAGGRRRLTRVTGMTSPAQKPSVEIPDGKPPTELVIEDLSADDREQLRRDAYEDQLTGIGNRRALQQRLDPLIASGGAREAAEAGSWNSKGKPPASRPS